MDSIGMQEARGDTGRAVALAIGDASVVAVPPVDYPELLTSLMLGDAEPLPTVAGKLRKMAAAFELGLRTDVTGVEDMSLIEIGTGAIGPEIAAIDEVAIAAIAFVVDGMAVCAVRWKQ